MTKFDISWLRKAPIAHRGLHDKSKGIWENTLSAAQAAVEQGYAIEVDLHPARDLVPMVFHDNTLDRLTDQRGSFRNRTASELGKAVIGGTSDHVPRLDELLRLVDGKVGLVLELKGVAGSDDGFVQAVLDVLNGYSGPVALMSFDHWLLKDLHDSDCNVPVGLTAEGNERMNETHWQAVRAYDIDFVSYSINDLPNAFVHDFRATGKPVITWTIRTVEQAQNSARYADQITFEGFLA